MAIETLEKIISDRGSKYAVSGGFVSSKEQANAFLKELKKRKKFAKATHNSWAVILDDGSVLKSDDGESGAGLGIARVLEGEQVSGVIVVVTRWYGGVQLGGDRFRHVSNATQIFLRHWAEHR
ncbi:MAG: putative IMPACT (imprinted ancient) family translation regulator [Paracoccaceae bacterium]|jgi:putative IMPACT (imprinted ancient) family translation regulator